MFLQSLCPFPNMGVEALPTSWHLSEECTRMCWFCACPWSTPLSWKCRMMAAWIGDTERLERVRSSSSRSRVTVPRWDFQFRVLMACGGGPRHIVYQCQGWTAEKRQKQCFAEDNSLGANSAPPQFESIHQTLNELNAEKNIKLKPWQRNNNNGKE